MGYKAHWRIGLVLLLVGILVFGGVLVQNQAADAQKGSFQTTFMGFRSTQGGGGKLTTEWTTGNLGNTWAEGEWVPYQAVLTNVQTDYPGLEGMPDIEISYDFTNKGYRFVDLVKGIQVGTTPLANAQGWPQAGGDPYPMTTREELEIAQNSEGENAWIDFTLLDLPSSQVHTALDGSNGTPTDAVRQITIYPSDLIAAGLKNENTIVVYFLLHESRTFIWENSLQAGYNAPPTDGWGGYVYGAEPFSIDQRLGSGYVPGSSGHAQLEISGKKTVPIPIPDTLPGEVSGLKWLDEDMNGEKDPGETTLSGWRIYVSGEVDGITFKNSTLTDAMGNYSFPNLTSGTIWRISEDEQREEPDEDGYIQTYPYEGAAVGVATAAERNVVDQAGWGWDVALTLANPSQGDVNFGNFLADPGLEITKTGDALSKVGDDVTYTFVITNTGNIALEKVSVIDTVIGDITSDFPEKLDPLESQTVNITHAVPADSTDPLVNTVTAIYYVTGNADWTVSDDASHSVELFTPSITISKTGDTLSKVGDEVTYTIVVENTSTSNSPNLIGSVVDPMLELDEAINLAPGASATFTETYTILAGDVVDGEVVNTATVTVSPEGFPNVLTASNSHTVELFTAGVSITKTGDKTQARIGEDVEYTIVVTNESSVNAPDLECRVIDAMLGLDETFTLSFEGTWTHVQTYTIPAGTESPLVNTVTVNASPDGFPNEYEDEAFWSVELVMDPRNETAWAYHEDYSLENWDYVRSNNWGWTNQFDGEIVALAVQEHGFYEVDFMLIAGAGGNIVEDGTDVGTVTVKITQDLDDSSAFCVKVTYEMFDGYELTSPRLWIGSTPLPEQRPGRMTDAPGQFWQFTEPSFEKCGVKAAEEGDYEGYFYVSFHGVAEWYE